MSNYLFEGKTYTARSKTQVLRKAGKKVNDANLKLVIKIKEHNYGIR